MELNELKKRIKNFEQVQNKYGNYGAMDTEPDGEFQFALVNAAKGIRKIPVTGDDWQLYTCSMNCSHAAAELMAATESVVKGIMSTTVADLPDLIQYLKQYCWRCSL